MNKFLYHYIQPGRIPLVYLIDTSKGNPVEDFMGGKCDIFRLREFNNAHIALLKDRDNLPYNRSFVENGEKKVIRGPFLVFAKNENGFCTLSPECRRVNNMFANPELFWEGEDGLLYSRKVYASSAV